VPQTAAAAKLVGGRDGAEQVGAEDFIGRDEGPGARSGLRALAAVEEVAALAVPDAMGAYVRRGGPQADLEVQRVQDAMVDLCENAKDRFAILDLPPTRDIDLVRRWRRRVDSSYAAFYFPWVVMPGADGAGAVLPPSGLVAGVFSRCDTAQGAHKAPANEPLTNAMGVTLPLLDDDLGRLNAEGINVIRTLPGRGTRIWGARTASDDPAWRYVNVRRLFILIRRSIAEGTQWVVFEPNNADLWQKTARQVSLFLEGQWRKGAFAGAAREEAFFVKCDAETNPADVRDAGQMVIQIGAAPALPAEFIVFDVAQEMGDQGAPEKQGG
jgi:phage tail sheath protein FI